MAVYHGKPPGDSATVNKRARILEAALLVLEHCIKGGWGYIPSTLISEVHDLFNCEVRIEDIEGMLGSIQVQAQGDAEDVMLCAEREYHELSLAVQREDTLCAFIDDCGLAMELSDVIEETYGEDAEG